MKNDEEKLYHHRWGSNNSFEAKVGMDYEWHAKQSQKNGEPGYIWLDNARHYGRMKDGERFDDVKVMGFNPCVEQQLEDGELCCLVETFPAKHETYEDYLKTLRINTKKGLAQAKKRGVKLGNTNAEISALGGQAQKDKAKSFAAKVFPVINEIKNVGKVYTLRGIANALNARGVKTRTQKKWHASSVRNIIKLVA